MLPLSLYLYLWYKFQNPTSPCSQVMACTRFSEKFELVQHFGRRTNCINLKLLCCLVLEGPSRVMSLPHQRFTVEGLKNWYMIQEECWLIFV